MCVYPSRLRHCWSGGIYVLTWASSDLAVPHPSAPSPHPAAPLADRGTPPICWNCLNLSGRNHTKGLFPTQKKCVCVCAHAHLKAHACATNPNPTLKNRSVRCRSGSEVLAPITHPNTFTHLRLHRFPKESYLKPLITFGFMFYVCFIFPGWVRWRYRCTSLCFAVTIVTLHKLVCPFCLPDL